MCRIPLDPNVDKRTRALSAEQAIEAMNLNFSCRNGECTFSGPKRDLEEHEETCEDVDDSDGDSDGDLEEHEETYEDVDDSDGDSTEYGDSYEAIYFCVHLLCTILLTTMTTVTVYIQGYGSKKESKIA